MDVFIKVTKDELFSDDSRGRREILMCLAAHSQYFLPVDSQYSSPVEIADSIDLFSLYILFSHFRPRDALMGIFFLFFH